MVQPACIDVSMHGQYTLRVHQKKSKKLLREVFHVILYQLFYKQSGNLRHEIIFWHNNIIFLET